MNYKNQTKQFAMLIEMGKMFNKVIELWRTIEDYPNYSISTFGRVRNDTTQWILKPQIDIHGYYRVTLCGKAKKNMKIHRLVANAFIENVNNKYCVDHIDRIKSNNNVSNLRFATSQENNMNKSKQCNNTSGTTGVVFEKKRNKWRAHIKLNGIKKLFGLFKTIEEAILKRKDLEIKFFGEFRAK
jgi:hypothetical protein